MIGSVNGVIIWTHDLDRLTKFYTETMGFTPHSIRSYFVNFEWGDMRFSIGSHDEIKGQAADPYRIMINFDVQDIHTIHQTLVDKGVEFIRPPEQEHWGGWVTTLLDPDGNMLQLLQQPPDRKKS
ncbi:MAG: VOC family protein [SAR202 cluster bacterium]|mgnify:FL=1|jgi:predicted enzyme related to lactoylglutathione lyase|nr:VOC family protein [SAR202 cluster bacterium]MDP6715518.1 VOC family protein [SAR202 cluster bacterium]